MNTFLLRLKNGDCVEVQSPFSLQHFIANAKEQQGVHVGKTFYPWHTITEVT